MTRIGKNPESGARMHFQGSDLYSRLFTVAALVPDFGRAA